MMETADKYCCRTLPMRNWYKSMPLFFTVSQSILPFHLSDITYEELILAPSGRRPPVTWATNRSRTLPMRNWYFCSYITNLRLHQKVGHYLWGIDTNDNVNLWAAPPPSDITYEELILLHTSFSNYTFFQHVGHYLWGIDTLFIHIIYPPLCFNRSDITYEELILSV